MHIIKGSTTIKYIPFNLIYLFDNYDFLQRCTSGKGPFLIFVIEFGIVIPLRDSQSMNIHSSMVSILGRSTLTNFIHPWNAPDSISITPGGILILSRPHDKNAYFFMHLSASGREIMFMLEQFVKASLPKVSTYWGSVIFSN